MSKIEKLTPEQVSTDLTVQRTLDQHRVQAIADKLRLDSIGVPTVSRRDTGAHVVVDGQHRLRALELAGYGARPMDMTVFEDLTIEQEAELFRLLNNTKSLTALDKFRIALVEKDPESLAINLIVERNGYVTSAGAANSAIAVVSLRAIYRRDMGDTLSRTLTVCSMAWGARKHATHQTVIGALAAMLFRYGHSVSLDRLADKLKQDRDGSNPSGFLGTIKSLADVNGSNTADAGAGKLVTIYNRHYDKSSMHRLGDWK